jgi:transposase-like protein
MSLSKLRCKRRRTDPAQRAQLLAAFARSGLSAAEFARQQGLNYTTLCGWRQHRSQTPTAPAFVQVELAASAVPVELVIEVGALARLRLQSEDQITLAAKLLQQLNAGRPC